MFEIIGSVAASALSGLAGSALSNWFGRENAEHAADYSADISKDLAAWKARNLPKLEREGLEAAGINPLSAYGSIGSSSMPVLSVDSSYTPRFDGVAEAISRLPEVSAARDLKRQQILNLEADRSKVAAEKDLLKAQTDEIRSRIPKNEEQAGAISDERKGVIGFLGSKITVPEVWRKLKAFGEHLAKNSKVIWDELKDPSKVSVTPSAENLHHTRYIDLTGDESAGQLPIFIIGRDKNGKNLCTKARVMRLGSLAALPLEICNVNV